MIAKMLSESATAVYGMAGTISGAFYTVIMSSINATWVPSVFKLLDEGKFEKLRKNANYLTVLVAMCCFLLVMGAPEAIQILGGEQYTAAKMVRSGVGAEPFVLFCYWSVWKCSGLPQKTTIHLCGLADWRIL